MRELTIKGKQAFNGAMSKDFPVLEIDFVDWLLKAADLGCRKPSLAVAFQSFVKLGRRPEALMKALFARRQIQDFADADQDLRAITDGVQQTAAGLDLARVDELGPLALAIFGDVCRQGGRGVKKVFSAAMLQAYGAALGQPVGAQDVQKTANQLVDANILARDGHGI